MEWVVRLTQEIEMTFANILRKSPMFTAVYQLEDELFAREDVVHPTGESPVRFEIVKEFVKRGSGGPPGRMLPIMLPTLFGIQKSIRSLSKNPSSPDTNATPELLKEVEAKAFELGASSIGYVKVAPRWVFQNKAIAFNNAIVLTMEMDAEGINSAPSAACMTIVFETYRDLGRIANKLASHIRAHGFGAHAGHPLMGMALYPPLAQMAGLGWIGLNGIIITPEYGPRVRLAAVFTSIENLPLTAENEHSWVADYCSKCKICIKKCPPKALFGSPIDHGNGQITYVEKELCFPYFSDYYGCSVCVKVCPFNHVPYKNINSHFILKSKPLEEYVN
jgi:Pyruvate/2-oxoacid:ferredoxin oxidoreductase delta subunit